MSCEKFLKLQNLTSAISNTFRILASNYESMISQLSFVTPEILLKDLIDLNINYFIDLEEYLDRILQKLNKYSFNLRNKLSTFMDSFDKSLVNREYLSNILNKKIPMIKTKIKKIKLFKANNGKNYLKKEFLVYLLIKTYL